MVETDDGDKLHLGTKDKIPIFINPTTNYANKMVGKMTENIYMKCVTDFKTEFQ